MDNKIERIVEKQLKYYNKLDLDNFVDVFSEDIEVFVLGESVPYIVGRDEFRARYSERFKSANLHAKVTNRMIKGNTVIDYEEVSGIADDEVVIAIAIYEINDDCITKVRFVR